MSMLRSESCLSVIWLHNSCSKVLLVESCPGHVQIANCQFSLHGVGELEIFNIQSEQQQQRDDDLRSPLISAVHVNFLRTADFVNFQHSIRI